MDLVGKQLEDALRSFREDLIKINEGSKNFLEKHSQKPSHFLDEKENWRKEFERGIEVNDFLISTVEAQLNKDFGVKF